MIVCKIVILIVIAINFIHKIYPHFHNGGQMWMKVTLMCGRFALKTDPTTLAQQFELSQIPAVTARYNIAPTQAILAVRQSEQGRIGDLLEWGLIPAWAKDPRIASNLINARSETVAEKPSFRTALRQRRCLIIADGFYEWQASGGKRKQPMFFHMRDGKPFAMAGLWETWRDPSGSERRTCTILTTSPNELLASVHDRMPVILARDDYARWLDLGLRHAEALSDLFAPFPAEAMAAYPVGLGVNRVGNDSPACMEPLPA